jgi:hypothetical protein
MSGLLASLNHPHIATIHRLEHLAEHDLVVERVEGSTSSHGANRVRFPGGLPE